MLGLRRAPVSSAVSHPAVSQRVSPCAYSVLSFAAAVPSFTASAPLRSQSPAIAGPRSRQRLDLNYFARRRYNTTTSPNTVGTSRTEISPGARRLLSTVAAAATPNPHTMSLVDEKHEWGAVRVRQTFLDFFKEKGHTFGTPDNQLPPCMPQDIL